MTALYNNSAIYPRVISGPSFWRIMIRISKSDSYPLIITCKLNLGAAILEGTVNYTV